MRFPESFEAGRQLRLSRAVAAMPCGQERSGGVEVPRREGRVVDVPYR